MKSLLTATLLGVAVLALAACAGDGQTSPPDDEPDLAPTSTPELVAPHAPTSIATYTLNVDVVPFHSGGVVAQEPEPNSQGQYPAGTVVKLTAGPSLRHECKDTPYWAFIGWSADLTGSTPTAEIMIDSEKSVTAEFNRDAHRSYPRGP